MQTEMYMMAIGSLIRLTAKARISMQTEPVTVVIGSRTNNMGRALRHGLMARAMKECTEMARKMGSVL